MVLSVLVLANVASAGAPPKDPFNSPMWGWVYEEILEQGQVIFDDRVKVDAPDSAEGNFQVPVSVRVDGLDDVTEIILIVDLNPILKTAKFTPNKARPYFALRVKMGQASVIRAAARTKDGVWHLGGKYVDASGGGCTVPSVQMAAADWESNLNNVQAQIWPRENGVDRIRTRIIHPMDTGLSGNIPAFFMEHLSIKNAEGVELAHLQTFEPVSEDPVITFEVDAVGETGGYSISGMDNNGNEISAWVEKAPKS
ncbi:MAG: quinoprotein dehydrogenase-associated SoxYZ-like carrier [Rhodospirillaceae bacterium]|nr:quinoprotein dehydrogenase-associated SoxYZ-like carrier [Rhodospirillaceae bacterium]MBL6930311.1 quinoprotein dehydrogenase-associated SoxYZ-like carrier [Rhodospirillales bacterium]